MPCVFSKYSLSVTLLLMIRSTFVPCGCERIIARNRTVLLCPDESRRLATRDSVLSSRWAEVASSKWRRLHNNYLVVSVVLLVVMSPAAGDVAFVFTSVEVVVSAVILPSLVCVVVPSAPITTSDGRQHFERLPCGNSHPAGPTSNLVASRCQSPAGRHRGQRTHAPHC